MNDAKTAKTATVAKSHLASRSLPSSRPLRFRLIVFDLDGTLVDSRRDIADAARNYFELRLRHLQSIMDVNVNAAALKRAAGVD